MKKARKDFSPEVRERAVRLFQNLPDGRKTFYDVLDDVLVPNGGWTFSHVLDVDIVLWIVGGKRLLSFGPRWKVAKALHEAGAAPDAPRFTHAVGPVIKLGPLPIAPHVALELGVLWWASHPYRTGRDTAPGLPKYFLALSFHDALLTW